MNQLASKVASTFVVEAMGDTEQADLSETLIDVADWTLQSAQDDSYSDHRPDSITCPDNAWYEQDGTLEVKTGYCNYLSVVQPSKAAINPGDNIHLVVWHGPLRFDEPEEAHVAITIGGKVIWEDTIEIPSEAGIYDISFLSPVTAPVGEKVVLHVHNHGYNNWTLLSLEVQRLFQPDGELLLKTR